VLVGGRNCPLYAEREPLDLLALKAEMSLAEARGQARAKDLQLALLLRQPELDAVPIEPCGLVSLARLDRG